MRSTMDGPAEGQDTPVQCLCGATVKWIKWSIDAVALCGPDCDKVPPLSREGATGRPRGAR